jgi:hypothetical protein
MFPGSLVDWDIAFDPSFPVVLTNLPGIVRLRRNIVPGTAGGQDVQNAVEQTGGHIGVGRCGASLVGGISGQSPRDHRQVPGRP